MELVIYQVDAFAEQRFQGNPAAVVPLTSWLPDQLLQNIALENNLAETAFYVKEPGGYHIRWFTPTTEVDLCGHATLATAYVLMNHEGFLEEKIIFKSKSGPLSVSRKGKQLVLDFPADTLTPAMLPEALGNSFHIKPTHVFRGKTDFMLVFENESQIRSLQPDLIRLASVPCRGVIVTAPGDKTDFVSRFFGPQSGVNEDPVTGSAHTSLTPYWANRTGKRNLSAIQCSSRGGRLDCVLRGDRVEIAGQASLYLIGKIFID
ncbi:MAG: PhzF family phenazine biosynthesis protein [Cyclobacteriaceae bacterium]|jgi:PhzF family phenazine biosynthesis protein|nr:isomerase [Cytophagales bacterium]HNP77043.1 PhzF family phenazine biosynthesis protein [Cyclobacteriaceae bacterium]HQQ81964.1 PhzF family phenazine biosynthesis protein [Cyclobacteriaceae bacterium]